MYLKLAKSNSTKLTLTVHITRKVCSVASSCIGKDEQKLITDVHRNLCYLLRFIILSGIHGAFHIPLMGMRETWEFENYC